MWLSQQELFLLPGLSDHGAEPGALGHSSLSLQMFFPCMGAENIPRNGGGREQLPPVQRLPWVPSAQPRAAPVSPSTRWCQENLQSYREMNSKSLFAKAGTSGTAGSCSLSETLRVSRNTSHSCGTGMVPKSWCDPAQNYLFTACKKHPLPR